VAFGHECAETPFSKIGHEGLLLPLTLAAEEVDGGEQEGSGEEIEEEETAGEPDGR